MYLRDEVPAMSFAPILAPRVWRRSGGSLRWRQDRQGRNRWDKVVVYERGVYR